MENIFIFNFQKNSNKEETEGRDDGFLGQTLENEE